MAIRRFRPAQRAGSSTHADPLRSVHADRVRRASRQVKRNPAGKWTAVVDHDRDGPAVFGICDGHLRSKGQRAMGGRVACAVERLTTRGSPPRNIVGRDHVLPRAASMRFGVREEPGEATAVRLR